MDVRSVLAESALFANLSPQALGGLAAIATSIELRSGERLFAEGEPSDYLYIVATGRLRATLSGGFVAGFIGRLELIGEVGVLSSEPRSASVYAVRDSLLIKIAREALVDFLIAHPTALIAITRVLITRLRQNQRQVKLQSARSPRAYALIPAAPNVDVTGLARSMSKTLSAYGPTRLLDAEGVDADLGPGTAQTPFQEGGANARLMAWLNETERRCRYLVYCAGPEPDAWSTRCMRQADRVLVVGESQAPPLASPMLSALKQAGSLAAIELVLLRPDMATPGDVLAWRNQVGSKSHYFLRPDNADDMARLARQLTGRGLGLVLGGGGARGFAHIGLMRALEELKIPVDITGGSSMGAFIAALLACGYSSYEMMHIVRETFVTHNYLNDYVLPRVALIRGRKFFRRLHEIFDDRRIEQLRMPFFCVSTNLTRGEAMVHDQGPLDIWLAASMAVPGVAPPIGYKGELFADGAVINSLPTDIMQNLERGPIIASDVSTEGDIRAPGVEGPDPEALLHYQGPGKPPNLVDILFRTATLTSESGVQTRASRADLYLRMPVAGIGMFEWKRLEELVQRGHDFAHERLLAMRDQLLK